jgi:glycosyltransferase involved in cell wall biosynthesis
LFILFRIFCENKSKLKTNLILKILFTHHIFNQKIGGVSRYFYEICKRLLAENQLIFLTKYSINIYFSINIFKENVFLKNINFPGKWRIVNLLQLLHEKRNIKKHKFDIIHHTGEDPNIFRYSFGLKPIVITVHDLTPELYYSSDKIRLKNRKICIENSTAIICVSQNTKDDLLKYYPSINKKKVFVIYHGCSTDEFNYQKNEMCLYILYIGSRYIYKNFIPFLNSISELLKNKNLFLYCTGHPFTKEEIYIIDKLGLKCYVINKGIVSEEELANLYHNAACFVYPSLYEGFGIPILEAFKHKCPVVLSDNSCFPEIAKNAAFYFDPQSPLSIQNAILNAISKRQELINLGNRRMRNFSWSKAAQETLYVYKWAIKNHNLGD